ncbi:LamB/YcsF family protein [Metabacillus sp. GX 13764]|uniref:LamB/YcsF family protein n=1 Tax=Metabacillus kandeliae TaxID=2900151 RepID=UPI001E659E30|nr:5-oxoprolinase subunit PxpA [Metabacillus kandeliae]MCD7032768.1 LamB/YcsF family protein [Metabacillus kandeliae]
MRADLNCDLGESYGAYKIGNDEEILRYVTSANIACGFHAGDPGTMRKTVSMALANATAIGAHPGLPDLPGFGRRNMNITPAEAYEMTVYQIGALAGFVKAAGGRLQHVKPHGALYNMAAKDAGLAKGIAEAVYDVDAELVLFGLSGSELIKQGEKTGLRTASEVFADRTYQDDGSLTPRSSANALITNDEDALQQAVRMVTEKTVKTVSGQEIPLQADTICIHGDGPHALSFAKSIQNALQEASVTIQPFSAGGKT